MDLVGFFALIVIAVVYSWAVYNIPVLVVGVWRYRRDQKGHSGCQDRRSGAVWPRFSVLIPAKNEAKVLPRLLRSLLRQRYPKDRVEVIVMEDGSTDGTAEVCRTVAASCDVPVKLVQDDRSCGKPAALNRGLQVATGDVVAMFDADSIVEDDALRRAAAYFEDRSVVAVQGRTLTVNSDMNMLTKFIALEEAAYCEACLRGRDALNLFVHLKGSCQFIRRDVLETVGGWRAEYISDDFEISARLTEQGHRIRYAPDVQSWGESPQRFRALMGQRIRWFRGAMEVALNYGRLMRKPSAKTMDAEVTLLTPFVLILSLLCYVVGPVAFCNVGGSTSLAVSMVGWGLFTASIVSGALALLYVAQPRRVRDLLWMPFIYAYWTFQVVLATWALLKIALHMPYEWTQTPKTGTVATTRSIPEAADS